MNDDTVPRFQGVYRRNDSSVYQFGLKPPRDLAHRFPPGGWAVRCSLETKDINEANAKAKALHAEWALRFEAMRREDNPQQVTLNPALSAAIAAELRRWVLQADDNMRDFPEAPRGLLVREARAAAVREGAAGDLLATALPVSSFSTLRLGQPTLAGREGAALSERDPLAGLTDAEAGAVERWNAKAAADAAITAARRDLRPVCELADAVARSMGLMVDWATPEGREGLVQCLKAHREALADVLRRDRGDIVDTPAEAPAPTFAQPSAAQTGAQGHTFAELFENWRKHPQSDRTEDRTAKTEDTYRSAAARLADLLPDGKRVESTTREDARNVLAALRESKNRGALSQNTIVNLMSRFRTLMQQAVEAGWIDRNPFAELRMKRVETARDEWSIDDLRRLFDDPLFTSYRIPQAARAGLDAAYWLPIMGLYTGARISELAQLRVIDVEHTEAAGWVLHIRHDEAAGLRTKNAASVRRVPMHPELVRLGLIEYREAMMRLGAEQLWPAVVRCPKNGAGGEVSKWFGAYKTSKGFGPDRVFHCFRNTLETRMRALGVHQAHINAIAGHSGKDGASDGYAKLKPADVRPSLERLSFPGLSLAPVFTQPAWKP